ncbi:MAG: DNA-binding protein WhiA [Clostridia bacterium]|nr:DNA-binding protein WhiA [Clostridia bacterium]
MPRDQNQSFAGGVKDELIRLPMGKSCCQISEIGALTRTSGHLQVRGGGRLTVTYRMEHTGTARRLYQLLKTRLQVSPVLRYAQSPRLGGRRTWVLSLNENDSRILLEALHMAETDEEGRMTIRRTVPRHPLTRQCCRRAFLRAAFLGAGTMANPEKSYHMEWRAEDERLAEALRRLLEKAGMSGVSYERKGKTVVCLKRAEQISDMLALMGASSSVLKMENIRVNRQTRLRANRAANCDEHNSERMLDAAQRQARACRDISLRVGLFTLPQALREMARVRMENPELSLAELGEMMDPPLSKSAVNHRLRRLVEIADRLE